MGRLMDWADWVMSCCGVSSVAMSQMVRKIWEHKTSNISGIVSWNGLIFGHNIPWGVPNYRWHYYISVSVMVPL